MANIPYGYRIVNGSAVIDAEMQEQVIALYTCFAGGATYKVSQAVSGVKRTPKGCRHILQDSTYLGDDFYPPLLDKELFEMAQTERIRRGPGRGGRKKRREMPVFTQFCLDAEYPEEAEGLAGAFSLRDNMLTSGGAGSTDPFSSAARFYERIIPTGGAVPAHIEQNNSLR